MSRVSRGFTLIETLVALAVLSFGLLGAAAMLLDSLRGQAGALRRIAAISLVRDMADRIRANPRGGAQYDTRTSASGAPACEPSSGCDTAQRAAADRAHFASAARALLARDDTDARVEFAPATGPATPAHYLITLSWSDARDGSGTNSVALQVPAQSPVAG
jgi:type IV pilus modification protein PilV